MTVKDLIESLGKFDPDLEVLCCTEDDSLLPEGHGIRLLDILDVKALDAERRRGDDQVPSMKFGARWLLDCSARSDSPLLAHSKDRC
jgi:hypothetical protein